MLLGAGLQGPRVQKGTQQARTSVSTSSGPQTCTPLLEPGTTGGTSPMRFSSFQTPESGVSRSVGYPLRQQPIAWQARAAGVRKHGLDDAKTSPRYPLAQPAQPGYAPRGGRGVVGKRGKSARAGWTAAKRWVSAAAQGKLNPATRLGGKGCAGANERRRHAATGALERDSTGPWSGLLREKPSDR